MLSDSWATMETPSSMIILTGLMQSIAKRPYPWHLLYLSIEPNLRFFFGTFVCIIYFDVLVLNIIPERGKKSNRLMRLGRWRRS